MLDLSVVVPTYRTGGFIEELCTRILVISRGKAVAIGTIAEIVATHPELAGRTLEEMFIALTGDNSAQAATA